MNSAAFVTSPLAASIRTNHQNRLPTCNRQISTRNRINMTSSSTLWTRICEKATADMQLVRKASQNITKATAVAALTTIIATSNITLAEVPTSAPSAAVYDDAGMILRSNAKLFGDAATNLQQKQGVNVRFVFVKTLPYGETPDEYAVELAGEWGLGDSDILFVASPKLARAGVFVGEKASNRLTKDIAESIANETYTKAASEERYGMALLDVSNRLIPVLSGEQDPGPPEVKINEVVQNYKTKKETSGDRNKYVTVVVVILVISVVAPLIQTYWYVKDD